MKTRDSRSRRRCPRGGRARERRERLQPHVARHGQDSPALLLVVHVQLAERRILRYRACQVDAEVVRTARTGLGKALKEGVLVARTCLGLREQPVRARFDMSSRAWTTCA